MQRGRRLGLRALGAGLIVLGGLAVILGLVRNVVAPQWGDALAALTPTPEPLVPTVTPIAETFIPAPEMGFESAGDQFVFPPEQRFRLGIGVPMEFKQPFALETLGVGWFMRWIVLEFPQAPPGVEFVQTVRMWVDRLVLDTSELSRAVEANPSATWLIGNEPDVRWQDNVTPETYARLYHLAYTTIHEIDSSATVLAGGISQPTPLRLYYLDQVLAAYQSLYGVPLPAEGWHIHNYMLREERDSWGVDIPPGISDDAGILFEIEDSGNLEQFKAQIVAFRTWMQDRDYRDVPLWAPEYGIPMPEDYGFPPERVEAFMVETWRYFLSAQDAGIGYPGDDNHLVQRWGWFSMGFAPYPTGNLIDPETGAWTPLGLAWMTIVNPR
ncbi:MAG: hypothetical protein JXB35_03520 [Anaerolineae bacterium]|nr:hypothetical protein [Anaerolineae bacterium]